MGDKDQERATLPGADPGAASVGATVYGPVDQQALAQAEAQVAAEWPVGETLLDLYEVTGILGEGGMGKVYKVHHKGWNADLAVKSPRSEIFSTAGGKENFIREAETWVNLGLHPHTVSCYYVRTLGDIPRVFAEYVEGGSLSDWIRTRKLYEGGPEKALEKILDIAIQFAWGLDYAHERGLVHQDVKPANVMVTADGTAKVTDFGLAKARGLAGEAAPAATGQRSILVSTGGMTPAYCSPEQAARQPLTRKTDIWSWGLSVLEMFTGEVTWMAGQAAAEALGSYLEMGTDDGAIPRIPETVAALLKKCFAHDPEARPQTMREIGESMREIYEPLAGKPYARAEPKAAELTADSLNNRAVSYLDLGKEKEAHEAWQAALAADPQHLESTYNRGLVLWRRGQSTDDLLVRQLDAARRSQGNRWDGKYMLALVHLERADVESALPLLEEAAREVSGESEVQAILKHARSGGIISARCVRTFEGHQHGVQAVCLSPDGCWALSGSGDNMLRLWEVATGCCLRTFEGHTELVESVCMSADGRWALSGSQDASLRLWDVATGRCVRTFEGHAKGVRSVCLSADGRWTLSAGYDEVLCLWEVATGRCLPTFEGHKMGVNSVCFSADGRWALSGGCDSTLRLWEVASGRCLRTFEGHTAQVVSVCLSADSRWALSGSLDKTLRLWEVPTGRCLRKFEAHTDFVQSVCLSADSRWALSGSHDKTLRLWEVASGRCLRTFEGHTDIVESVCLSADGGRALSGSMDKTLRLWELPREGARAMGLRIARVHSLEKTLEAEIHANRLRARAERAIRTSDFGAALVHLREARSVMGHEYSPQNLDVWGKLTLSCRRIGVRAAWPAKTLHGHAASVTFVCLTSDDRWVLSGDEDGTLRVWDVATASLLHTIKLEMPHLLTVPSISASLDGRCVLSGGQCGTLRLWEVATGRCLRTLFEGDWDIRVGEDQTDRQLRTFKGHIKDVTSVCLSMDGRWALSGSEDRTLRLWEVATGRCLRTFVADTKRRKQKVFLSRDARWALSGNDETVKVWEMATGRCLGTIKRGVPFDLSADGRRAISRFSTNSIDLWEVASGRCLSTLKGHGDWVRAGCLSADGRWALSGSADKTVRIWELATGRCLRTLEGHTDWVESVCLSAGGRWALSGSRDKTVRVWELDWELEAPEPSDWDAGAQHHLENFLTLHTFAATTWEKISLALTFRRSKPVWTEKDFKGLLYTLGCAGYGWLRPEGVRKKLEELAANWHGPSPLPGAE